MIAATVVVWLASGVVAGFVVHGRDHHRFTRALLVVLGPLALARAVSPGRVGRTSARACAAAVPLPVGAVGR